ncbi:MAG: biopolymer transporter ExbD [Bacteroidota bacterium]
MVFLRNVALLVFFMVLNSQVNHAQNSTDVELPKIEKGLGWNFKDKKGDIHISITKNHELYINGSRMRYWDNIVTEIMRIDRSENPIQIFLSKVMFHVDLNTKYRFVDRVKEEIGRTKKKWSLERIKTRKHEFDSVYLKEIIMPQVFKEIKPNHSEEVKKRSPRPYIAVIPLVLKTCSQNTHRPI